MNTLTSIGPVEPEILVKRPWKWWRLLWVRCLAAFVLMWVVTWVFLWSYCRSAWAVFRVNGVASPPHDSPLQSFRRVSGLASYVGEFFVQDRDVVSVLLFNTGVDDQWLVRLRRFTKLTNAALDGGQVGPGLQNLADLPELKVISVIGSQMTVTRGWIDRLDSKISGRHFLLIPQIELLGLSGFKGTISDLDQLDRHPHLRALTLGEVAQLSETLRQIEKCQNIKVLSIQQRNELDEESLQSICRMSHLESLNLSGVTKTDEVDSRLRQSLESTNVVWRP